MNLPHPGELRHKVSIGKTENAVNANGYKALICLNLLLDTSK